MRTKIIGDNLAARTLRGFLLESGLAVSDYFPTYTIEFREDLQLVVDGIDCSLERRVCLHLEEAGFGTIILQREGGIRDNRAIRIHYPVGRDMEVATAVYRALLGRKKKWHHLWVAALLLLASVPAHAQYTIGRAWDRVTVTAVDPGDSANSALRVNVVAGGAGGGISQLQVRSAGNAWTDVGFAGGNQNIPVNCITGCAGGSNPSIGSIGSTSPTSATLAGMALAGNMVALSATPTGGLNSLNVALRDPGGQDLDFATNGGTYNATDHGLIMAGYDGATNYRVLRTTSNGTLRIDPIGTTTQPVSGTFWQTTQPVSGTFWQATQPVSIASMPSTPVTGTFWQATQPVSIAAAVTVAQATPANLTATVTPIALTKGTQGATGFSVQELRDAGRTSRMFTATVASTATAETLITLTYSNALAATSTCSSCAITSGKKMRIMGMWISARNSTGTTASNVTVNLRAAVGGATTASSPLQMHFQAPLPASAVAVLFPPAFISESFELDANGGTNTFGVTITHPQWVTGSVVATFDLSIATYEY